MLHDHVLQALGRAARSGSSTAILAVDVDRAERVDGGLRPVSRDRVLVEFGRRLQATLRASDTLSGPYPGAQAGTDQFFVVCGDVNGEVAVAAIAARLAGAMSSPLRMDDGAVAVTATLGVVLGAGGPGPDDGLRALSASTGGEQALTGVALRRALDDGQLRLAYQPKVAVATGKITGVEALVRWAHPLRGIVPPDEFIPLAEREGLIAAIGAWVLEQGCCQAKAWATRFPNRPPVPVSINVSVRQFDTDVIRAVAGALDRSALAPGLLCLEVTETIVMRDVTAAVATMHGLKALGVNLSIDDFGTGYSSLAYLRRLPLDEIKVDKSFVAGLGQDPEDTAIVGAVVAMAHALDLAVVAEGVETEEQLNVLRALGCEYAQGFYFARPGPPAEFEARLTTEAEASWAGHPDAAAQAADTYRSQVVVVADDDPDVRQLVQISLTTAGFEVHAARSGLEVIDLVRQFRPDCVVLDVMMPNMDGFQVCRVLRADPSTSDCTIVMLTATSSPVSKVAAFEAQADDYMVKPFSPRDLVSRVRAAINRRQQPRTQEEGGSTGSAP